MIKLASPDIRQSDINRTIEVLKSGNLVEGANAKAFEKKLQSFTCIDSAILTTSATAGLFLCLQALGIKSGDYVIVPAFTFPATANVVESLGANVIFCDVDSQNYSITPELLQKTLQAHKNMPIKAAMIVHEFGYPAPMEEIAKIAKKYEISLIEDAACALGTISDGHHVGHYSDCAVVSFHPRKAITSGEGGAILSSNKELIEKIKILKNHGIVRIDGQIDFVDCGLNFRMSDFQAALLIGQLGRFKTELKKRKEYALLYSSLLSGNKSIKLPTQNIGHSWQSYMITLDNSINRTMVMQKMREYGIETNMGAQALPALSYYRQKYNTSPQSAPVAQNLFTQGLVLPLYGKLTPKQIETIAKTLIQVLNSVS
jgi:dTDP-4-amino-4,6-dideoxygalactose transaminase